MDFQCLSTWVILPYCQWMLRLRACLKSHFGQSYLHGNRVFSSKLGFFRNPERPTLFKRILSLYSANRVRSMIGTWFSSPTVWENQRLPPNTVRSGLPNPQHLGTISCFLKQVLRNRVDFISLLKMTGNELPYYKLRGDR